MYSWHSAAEAWKTDMMSVWKEFLICNLRAIIARALARIVGMNRELSWVAFEIFLPLLAVASYAYLYKALNAPLSYLGYVILGGSMIGFWMNVLWGMATQLYWEKERGQLELVLIAPFSRMALLIGMALGGMYGTGLRAIFTFMCGISIFQVPLRVTSWGSLFLTFFVTLLALYGLGMIGSSLFLMFGRSVLHISKLLQEPVFLFTGFYFPVRSLGFTVALCASIIPITLGLDAMRQILFSESPFLAFLPVPVEQAILAIMAVIYFVLACWALRSIEERARREGRLTLRWQ
jgi:ABC-2 type transport system permease protein